MTKVKDIKIEDRDILESRLKKYREAPDSTRVTNNIKEDPTKDLDIESKQAAVESLINDYTNISALADEISIIIEQRAKDVKVLFDPDKDITLRDSIRRLFGIDTDIVEYWMYKQCLEMKEELAKEDRKAMEEL